ncbi:hypothetical protein N9750_00200 [Polaribacter sp.]|nr:hypothetical protein [Polaribacter sp.]
MKKLLYLLISVTLFGCNSDDDILSDTELLVKSINWNFSEGGADLLECTEEFTYEGKKILQVVRRYSSRSYSDNETIKYIYTNNLISRVSTYDDNQELQEQRFYEYDNSGRLIFYEIFIDGQLDSSSSFVYGSSNTSFTVTTTNTYESRIYTQEGQITNGNIISVETIGVDASGVQSDTYDLYTLSYDNKHTPFENIVGVPEIILFNVYNFTKSRDLVVAKNNVVTFERTDENNDVFIRRSNFDYNNEDYPRSIIGQYSLNGGSSTASSDTVIEYY